MAGRARADAGDVLKRMVGCGNPSLAERDWSVGVEIEIRSVLMTGPMFSSTELNKVVSPLCLLGMR